MWWLLVADTDISKQLEGVLREGSQVCGPITHYLSLLSSLLLIIIIIVLYILSEVCLLQVVLAVKRSPSLYEVMVAKVDQEGQPR